MKKWISLSLTILLLALMPTTLQARYLNPNTGRFQTLDTYEGNTQEPQSLHKYQYGGANPIDRVDPNGNEFTASGVITLISSFSIFAQVSTGGAVQTAVKAKAQDPLPSLPTNLDEQLLVGLIFAESTAGDKTSEDEKISIGLTILNRTYYAVPKDGKRSNNRDFGDGSVFGAVKAKGQFLGYNSKRWNLVMTGNKLKTSAELEKFRSGERTHLIRCLAAARFSNDGSAPIPTGLAGIGDPSGQFPIAFNQAQNSPPGPRMFKFLRAGSHTFYTFKPGREWQ